MNILQTTRKLLRGYIQTAQPLRFMSQFFKWEGDFHNQAAVEFDTKVITNQISPALPDIASEATRNNTSAFSTELIPPAIHKEQETINAATLGTERQFDTNPYTDKGIQLIGLRRAIEAMKILRAKLIRSVELQAAQLLTTGTVNLPNENNDIITTIDFGLDSRLFPTTLNTWGQAGADVEADVIAVCNIQNVLGGGRSVAMLMNSTTWGKAMLDDNFKAKFKANDDGTGILFPLTSPDTSAGKHVGVVALGSWKLDIYLNDETYVDMAGNDGVLYLPDDYCVVLTNGYREATFGDIPKFNTNNKALPSMPNRITVQGVPIAVNSWFENNGEAMSFSIGSRPLLLPRNKSSVGAIKTTAA